MRGQVFTAMTLESERFPTRALLFAQQFCACPGGVFIEQIVWVSAPEVKDRLIHGDWFQATYQD